MEITKRSEATGIEHTREIDISEWEYTRYQRGELGFVQEAFPELSADDREFLVTGVTPEEWDELFGDIEEGDPAYQDLLPSEPTWFVDALEDEEADYTDYYTNEWPNEQVF